MTPAPVKPGNGRSRQLAVALIAIATLMLLFWSTSRYPALNEKAAMGGDLKLQDPMSFDLVMPVVETDPLWRRTMATGVNWVSTNQQGMTFGVLLGAGFLTLLPLVRLRTPAGYFSGSALGVAVGTPMGVCVNCAAPIASGMYAGGARLEMTLAAMISSPTLNIIVLTMMFSLLPVHLVLLKLGFTLLFLLLCLPLLSRYLFSEARLALGVEPACEIPLLAEPEASTGGWPSALSWYVRHYAVNLWFIARTTVPLMFLAGLLGALLVNLLPWNNLFPDGVVGGDGQLLVLCGLALFGIFLPVPIAFDVVMSAALLASGFPPVYVMTLLFTLGIFSVYSFSIVARMASWRIAALLTLFLGLFGVVSGIAAGKLDAWVEARNIELFYQTVAVSQAPLAPRNAVYTAAVPGRVNSPPHTLYQRHAAPGVAVYRRAHRARTGEPGLVFERLEAVALGLDYERVRPAMHQFVLPFSEVAGVSSGDVNADGWPDLLINSNDDLRLFINRGGEGFAEQPLGLENFSSSTVVAAGLVDLDDDGRLDVFFSAFGRGHYILHNRAGQFHARNIQRLPHSEADVARAVGFGDIDRDGRLDIAVGNYAAFEHSVAGDRSANVLYRGRQGQYSAELLPGPLGTTLSVLLSDINDDGEQDILLANDFGVGDSILLGQGDGVLRHITQADQVISFTGQNTMSIDSADIDNDLALDLLLVQITGESTEQRRRLRSRPHAQVCEAFTAPNWRARCTDNAQLHEALASGDPFRCGSLPGELPRLDCIATDLFNRKTRAMTPDTGRYCDWFQGRWSELGYLCEQKTRARKNTGLVKRQGKDYPASDGSRNFLFSPGPGGGYRERALELGVDVTGWTWNARFADLDNDSWQDLYLVTGWSDKREWETDLLLHNAGGTGFADITRAAGVENFRTTGGFSFLDMDLDGDLDIVSAPFDGPPLVYRNRSSAGHSLGIELRDERGNHFGVGSKVTIHFGERGGQAQLRELKLSGGYLSFDEPVLHFGLGQQASVNRIEVRWSTGEVSVLEGEYPAGYTYRVYRTGSETPGI